MRSSKSKTTVKIEIEDSKEDLSPVKKGNIRRTTKLVPKSESKSELDEQKTPVLKKEKLDLSKSPFPDYVRPTPDECIVARKYLSNLHWGSPDATMRKDSTVLETESPGSPGFSVLDSLIATILSQNTTDSNSWPAFQRLKKRFPTWDSAREAPVEEMEECIRSAGLAHTKSLRIHSILNSLASERPQQPLSLEHLRSEPDTAAAMAQLTRFSGVGPKTAACVAMFTLGRPEFPVDTHVLRLALALGWVPPGTGREAAYAHLNRRVPDALKLDLHVLLVLHGKVYRNDPSMLRRALAEAARAGPGGPTKEGKLEVRAEAALGESAAESGGPATTPGKRGRVSTEGPSGRAGEVTAEESTPAAQCAEARRRRRRPGAPAAAAVVKPEPA